MHDQPKARHCAVDDSTCSCHVSPVGEDEGTAVDMEEMAQLEQLSFCFPVLSKESTALPFLKVLELRHVDFVLSPFIF
jgi:hypothetical protein